jgi:Fe-S oxidoreductase
VLDALPGATFVEMPRTGRDAVCCGTSGFIHCDAASRAIQYDRLAEAAATGASTLITACPKCLIHFSCAQAEARRAGINRPTLEVQDFTVLAASLLADPGGAR